MLSQKPFSWAKPAYLGFSSSNFTVQDHILSIAGDAWSSLDVHQKHFKKQEHTIVIKTTLVTCIKVQIEKVLMMGCNTSLCWQIYCSIPSHGNFEEIWFGSESNSIVKHHMELKFSILALWYMTYWSKFKPHFESYEKGEPKYHDQFNKLSFIIPILITNWRCMILRKMEKRDERDLLTTSILSMCE
jgi:hypothetical protein